MVINGSLVFLLNIKIFNFLLMFFVFITFDN